ncbi:hypothetical protein AB0F17_18155 [Nonomuraea sp. NPDC026600]|uniref:hypothetical protein n=1 Tax=Nonomuraea sp. NPDC026600 TaxID=3155363 RepID=UPI003408111D
MNQEETAAYYDDPAHAVNMCDLLMRAFPTWVVWRRQDRAWLARHRTWDRERQPLADRNAGLLHQAMRETNIRGVVS